MTTDSPDVLADGRWECVRGVWRWVAGEPLPEPEPEIPAPRCIDCERKEWRPLRRGLCPACYTRSRKDPRPPPAERPCVWCASAFLPHDPRQTHCSNSCAHERAKARKRVAA